MDDCNNNLISGVMSSTTTFGNVSVTSNGSNDALLWKINQHGTTIWAYNGGSDGSDVFMAVRVARYGYLVLVGTFYVGRVTFRNLTLNNGESDATNVVIINMKDPSPQPPFPHACKASADPSKDGSDGTFYCINGGTVGGSTGSCTCTSCNKGYKGKSCEITCEPRCYPGGEFMSTYGADVECS